MHSTSWWPCECGCMAAGNARCACSSAPFLGKLRWFKVQGSRIPHPTPTPTLLTPSMACLAASSAPAGHACLRRLLATKHPCPDVKASDL